MDGHPAAFAIAALMLCSGCDPFRAAYAEKLVEGQQFAHYLQFPSTFQQPTLPKEAPYPGAVEPTFYFDHFGFRVSRASPDVLLVAGCGYFGYTKQTEVCSPNGFSIDTGRSYDIRQTAAGEWERASPIARAGGLRKPVVRPYAGKITRDGTEGAEVSGWNYRGKSYYYPRGDDVRGSAFMSSADGGLVLLIGVNKQKLPKGGFIVGDAEGGGIYGNYTIDIFQSNPAKRTAALDVDCNRASVECMASISIANSRWFAVQLI